MWKTHRARRPTIACRSRASAPPAPTRPILRRVVFRLFLLTPLNFASRATRSQGRLSRAAITGRGHAMARLVRLHKIAWLYRRWQRAQRAMMRPMYREVCRARRPILIRYVGRETRLTLVIRCSTAIIIGGGNATGPADPLQLAPLSIQAELRHAAQLRLMPARPRLLSRQPNRRPEPSFARSVLPILIRVQRAF